MVKFGEEYYLYSKNDNGCDFTVKGDWQQNYAKFVEKHFNEFKSGKTLDFGCAMGANTSALKDIGFDITGIDVSEWYVNNSPFENVKLYSYNPNKPDFPFEDETFDFIHSQQVIEHMKKSQINKVLKELNRVLKTDGIIYVATVEEDEKGIEKEPTHYSCLSVKDWDKYFKKAGFENITKSYKSIKSDSLPLHYNWVQIIYKKIK